VYSKQWNDIKINMSIYELRSDQYYNITQCRSFHGPNLMVKKKSSSVRPIVLTKLFENRKKSSSYPFCIG
jgi:hypothetical protein